MSYRVPEDLAWTEEDGVLYATRLGDGRVLLLEGAAGLVWRAADGAPDVDAVVDRLARRHGWEPDTIWKDVEQCVSELLAQGLLSKSGSEL